MKAKIKGLTLSTIAFTEIEMSSGTKLVMHGQEEAVVDLDTATILNEVSVLEGCNLIKCTQIKKTKAPKAPKAAPVVAEAEAEDEAIDPVSEAVEPVTEVAEVPTEPAVVTPEVEEIEDAPKKRGPGRPKGAKNKKMIKRADASDKPKASEDDANEDGKVIVVNENGKPVESKTITEADKSSPEESETTRASIEAMEEIEKEEIEAKEV